MNPAQHGFIKGKSCLSNLLRALDEITDALDRGKEVRIGYLDFQKAFDSVNHRLLEVKIPAFGISPNIRRWINDFLRGRSFQVKVQEHLSLPATPSSGVPQGTVLGPLLFILYTNDIPVGLNSTCLMFADDVKLVSTVPGSSQLQRDLDQLKTWSETWDLPLNIAKCGILSTVNERPPSIGTNELPEHTTVRDLGVIMDSSFTPARQCAEAANRARRALFVLKGAVSNRTPEVWIPLYCAYVRPHLEYCVQAWSPYLKKDMAVLEKVQRMATRWVTGLKGLTYAERLCKLGLFSLERRRLRVTLLKYIR